MTYGLVKILILKETKTIKIYKKIENKKKIKQNRTK